jgi:Type II secretion system (T2SS), protein M subtype b
MQIILDQFKWQLHRAIERLGALGNAALLLAVTASIAYFLLVRPMAARLAEASKPFELKQASAAPVTNASKLPLFLASLPPVAQRANATKTLMDVAASENLLLDEVSYKTESRPNDAINHYHVEFNLFASYPETQHFLSSLLNKMPFVSIESLTFQRESAQDDVVEARIHLVFHFAQAAQNTLVIKATPN